ncbi:MAG: hypothetical protein JEZ11_17875 [Desulfobacterales bacterium]|nr:hypothetical protein [Desulfobacterales bacterium]
MEKFATDSKNYQADIGDQVVALLELFPDNPIGNEILVQRISSMVQDAWNKGKAAGQDEMINRVNNNLFGRS